MPFDPSRTLGARAEFLGRQQGSPRAAAAVGAGARDISAPGTSIVDAGGGTTSPLQMLRLAGMKLKLTSQVSSVCSLLTSLGSLRRSF